YSGLGTIIVSVNLQTGTATDIGGTFSNINNASGDDTSGSGTNSTLTAADTTNAWLITAANGGTVGSFAFSNFGNLTGGTGDDTFTFGSSGSVSGNIDGGGGTDTLDYSSLGTSIVSVNLQSSTATDIGGSF